MKELPTLSWMASDAAMARNIASSMPPRLKVQLRYESIDRATFWSAAQRLVVSEQAPPGIRDPLDCDAISSPLGHADERPWDQGEGRTSVDLEVHKWALTLYSVWLLDVSGPTENPEYGGHQEAHYKPHRKW